MDKNEQKFEKHIYDSEKKEEKKKKKKQKKLADLFKERASRIDGASGF